MRMHALPAGPAKPLAYPEKSVVGVMEDTRRDPKRKMASVTLQKRSEFGTKRRASCERFMAGITDLLLSTDPDDLPAKPGAYVLLLRLPQSMALPPRFGGELAAGVYAYCGSARGPGGLRARCGRHLRPIKSRHWHIDWVSGSPTEIYIAGFVEALECDLFDHLRAQGAGVPVPGFGSSDCRRCPSHLVDLPFTGKADQIVRCFGNLFSG